MIEIFVAILGGAVGSFFTYLVREKLQNRKIVIDILMSYNSPEFIKVRNDAGVALRGELSTNNSHDWSTLHKNLNAKGQWECVSSLDHFFRNIDELLKNKLVDEKLTKALFAKIHNHWFDNYFETIDKATATTGKRTNMTQTAFNKRINMR